ncbi:hypothetical protein PAXRUDRAFT_157832 [Paxillus rubicundulus Ve08.2h10]|uniref:Unplaced genomic scaffold scaffold_1120, whole genome shotgun sequence n=1 Tax=Paxillus rubicundulus Ve08.2h10 TaxID=930991 RepID=A0A0D0DPC7_9AGAM|nr:hypothetical protein PAXRUDRAFT_157832 [Paxillus rubicundulus Ve08.2h10]
MPQVKTHCGKLKTISCPHCGKKFCTETNLLQHINQPMGSCYGLPCQAEMQFYEDVHPPTGPNNAQLPHSRAVSTIPDQLNYPDIELDDRDFLMTDPVPPDFGPGELAAALSNHPEPLHRKFVELYEGCSKVFPGGKTFMDSFREDGYTDERWENLYFPWASQEEWAFASWLLHSWLSMAAIDTLLLLKIFEQISLSFHTAKELRAWAEMLAAGPCWLFQPMMPEHPTKKPVCLFYCNAIECLQALLSHPLFESHISFVSRKVWTSTAKVCRVYDEWLSGDCAWGIQNALPPSATTLGVVLSSDRTNISVMSGNRMAHPFLISLANIDTSI